MPSLAERVAALPQFQGRAWEDIDPAEIQQALGQLNAADQAAYERSKRRWQIADRAAMAAAGATLGYGALSGLGVFGGGSRGWRGRTRADCGRRAVGGHAVCGGGEQCASSDRSRRRDDTWESRKDFEFTRL